MKNLLIVILLIIMASGCRSTKKITEGSNVTDKKTEIVQTVISSDSKRVANDKKVETTTITTKTEYYPPGVEPTSIASHSVGETSINATAPEPVEGKPKDKGAIKSTETIVTTTKESDHGVTEDNRDQKSDTNIGQKENTKTEEKVTDKKTVPIQWGWIFAIMALLVGVFIYLKRSKVFPWIKSVLSKMTGFLKI